MIRLRVTGLAALTALSLGVVAACGGDQPQQVSFSPAAYGEQVQLQPGQQYVGANGQTVVVAQPQNSWVCYFTDSYLEIALLHSAGLCPDAWTPMLMASISQGLMWHYRYAAYYDSPAYYGRYVPFSYRSTYVTHVHTFEVQHKGDIDKVESSAKWKGTDGKMHSGQEVKEYIKSGNASFGSGSVRSSAFSSGSARSADGNARPAATAPPAAVRQTTAASRPAGVQKIPDSSGASAPKVSSGFSSGSRAPSGGSIGSGRH